MTPALHELFPMRESLEEDTLKTVALLGTGLMGSPYAEHLVAEGLEVRLYNRTRIKAEAIGGATAFETAEEAASGADLLFSVLADDEAVLESVTGEVLSVLAPGGVHLSCSTISVEATQTLVDRAESASRGHLTCPFLGRPDFVQKKAHQFLISGTSRRREEVLKLLRQTCKGVVDFGTDPLAAVRGKLATNFVIAGAIVAMGEAFALLESSGIDPAKGFELWTSSLFDCPLYKNYGQKILDKDFADPLFRLSLGLKDTSLIQAEAKANGVSRDMIDTVRTCFAKSVEAGDGELDWTGVTKLLRK